MDLTGGNDPLVGRTIAGRYLILQPLGARLYRASQAPLDRIVTLRLLADDERLLAQASIAGSLSHPNTVRLFDFGSTGDGLTFVAMEHLQGVGLAGALSDGAFPQARAVHVAQQICRSLREAHALGIVHGALRSSSVVLLREQDDQDFVKVLDLGLRRTRDPSLLTRQTPAEVACLAPEQARNQPLDPRCDVYAVGALLYEMLTGAPPFAGATTADVIVRHLVEEPMPPRARRPDLRIDEALDRIVLRCLAKDRAARFASVDELLAQLKIARALITRTPIEAQATPLPVAPVRPASPPPPSRHDPEEARFASIAPVRRHRRWLGLAAVAALALAGFVALRSRGADAGAALRAASARVVDAPRKRVHRAPTIWLRPEK